MTILSSILPGLREVRAPLLAGYAWLLVLIVGLDWNPLARPLNGSLATLYDLAAASGLAGIGAMVSVFAYLVGSAAQAAILLVPNVFRSIRHKVRLKVGRSPLLPSPLRDVSLWLPADSPSLQSLDAEITRLMSAALQEVELVGAPQRVAERCGAQIRYDARRAANDLVGEPDLPATLLLSSEDQLFSAVDRLRGESELRLGLCPPLAVLSLQFAAILTPWLALSLIPVLLLVGQGVSRRRESYGLMSSAMLMGKVPSPAITAFKGQIDGHIKALRRSAASVGPP